MNENTKSDLTRRDFVKIGASASTLVVGFSLHGCMTKRHLSVADANLIKDAADDFTSLYLKVTADNTFHMTFDKAEMGQGVITGQATLFGEESDIAPTRFIMHPATADRRYGTGMGVQITGGSTSTSDRWLVLRRAGAEYRQAVRIAAAAAWGIAAEKFNDIKTDDGKVIHPKTGVAHPYADFNRAISAMTEIGEPPLKRPEEFKYIGKFSASIDAREKSLGHAEYGIDFSHPEARVAIILRRPIAEATLKTFDEAAMRRIPFVEDVKVVPSGIAVICRKYWQCQKVRGAVTEVMLAWSIPEGSRYDSSALVEQFRAALKPFPTEASKQGATLVTAEYELPFLAHAALEPQSITAWHQKDRFDVWIATQAPTFVRNYAQTRSGMSFDKIHVHCAKFLGGGFGRRGWLDVIAEGVELAMLVPYPVKLMWSREDDMQFSPMRPMSVHRLTAEITTRVESYFHQVAAVPILPGLVKNGARYMLPDWLPNFVQGGLGAAGASVMGMMGSDPLAIEGAKQDYDIPYEIGLKTQNVSIPVSFWRSVGNSHNGFVVESFMDELAHKLGKDPVSFRRELLHGQDRALRVLEITATKGGWGKDNPKSGRGLGFAYHQSFRTHVAEVVDLEVVKNEIIFKRITCVVDCGSIVNPAIVVAQMRSAIIFGISACMHGQITFKGGLAEQTNFDTYPLARLSEIPDIDVHIVPSDAPPTGVGEPGLPPLAAAVANAIFRISGKRLRRLPFTLN